MPPTEPISSDSSIGPSEDEGDPLFAFGPMPTEPLIARDRTQAFRFLSYGKGRRCVVTEDYEMMIAVGTPEDLKGYANGWFRAHGRLCKVVVAKSEELGWAEMVLTLEEDIYSDVGDGDEDEMDVELGGELDVGFLEAAAFFDDDDDDDYDMPDDLDFDPDFRPGLHPLVSETDEEEEEEEDDDDDYEEESVESAKFCDNCGSDAHNLVECSGPTDESGYLRGCALCNSLGHDVDGCALLDAQLDMHLVLKIYTHLVLYRCLKAPFYSEKMPWTKALLISRAWGFYCPGPYPWSHELAAMRKAVGDEGWEGGLGELEEEDPATRNIEAVREAIREGKVPHPGDIREWMPSEQIF